MKASGRKSAPRKAAAEAKRASLAEGSGEVAKTVPLQFHYIKGPGYRECVSHGAIGGITPQGKVWMALYAERYPLPRMTEFAVEVTGEIGEVTFDERTATPVLVDTRNGVIRHVEFSTYLDIDAAERLRDWLNDRITQIKPKK